VEPTPKSHSSSFSTASSGIVRYPIGESYAPNTALTWLQAAPDVDSPLELSLESLDLDDNCKNSTNPCACDALLVYEVDGRGVVSERDR
jgi:hypothetical protein